VARGCAESFQQATARPDPIPKTLKGWNNAGQFV